MLQRRHIAVILMPACKPYSNYYEGKSYGPDNTL